MFVYPLLKNSNQVSIYLEGYADPGIDCVSPYLRCMCVSIWVVKQITVKYYLLRRQFSGSN